MPEYKRDDSQAKWFRYGSWGQVPAELKGLLGLSAAVILVLAYELVPVVSQSLRRDIDRTVPEPSLASEPATGSVDQEREDSLGLGTESRQRIQAGLRSAGFAPGSADGNFFDANTRDAIRNWQASRGGQPTGFLSAAEAVELAGLGSESAAANRSELGGAVIPEELKDIARGLGSSIRTLRRTAVEPRRDATDATSARSASPTQDESSAGRAPRTTQPSGQGSRSARNLSVPSTPAQQATAGTREKEPPAERAEEPVPQPSPEVVEGPGRLTVRANATGATIQLDGGKALDLPLRVHQLAAGSYRATLSAFGFETFERDFDITPGKETVLDIMLKPTPIEELLREARGRYSAEDFRGAMDRARKLLTIHPEESAAILLLGESLYRLGEFQESEIQLRQAIRRGETVTLPAKHRHGGLGLREGFCRGALTLSKAAVSFRSSDQAKHGFTITPNQLKEVVAADKTYRNSVIRIDTKIQDRGNKRRDFDFVHWKTERVPERRDDPSFLTLQCGHCDGSMNVQAALMQYLYETSM